MSDVISSILGTFLGALIGIPAGLLLDRILRKKADATRRQQLRTAILNAVISNADVVATLKGWNPQSHGCPDFNVDLSIFEATASLKYEVLDDFELCQEIDYLRFDLSLLARTIDKLFDLEFDPSASMSFGPGRPTYNQLRPQLVNAIEKYLDPISKRIEELRPRLAPKASLIARVLRWLGRGPQS